jgi:hypothetical protein
MDRQQGAYMDTNDTTDTERAERRAARERRLQADGTVGIAVSISDLRVDDVAARSIAGFPDSVAVELAGDRIQVRLYGEITALRAVAVELDRQLARLEVEARVGADGGGAG